MLFALQDLETGEVLTKGKQIEIVFSDDDLRELPHVKRGKFVNELVQKAFLACLHFVRRNVPLLQGSSEQPVVSKDVHGSYTDVTECRGASQVD